MLKKCKIKKGDQVQVMRGTEKGKSGAVLKIDGEAGRVYVDALNKVKKTVKARSREEKGKIIEVEVPLSLSNVMIVCKKCQAPCRVRIKEENNARIRVCGKCGEAL